MGTSEEFSLCPSPETQNEITPKISPNGIHHDLIVRDDNLDNDDQDQDQKVETSAIVEKLETLELQGNGSISNVETDEEQKDEEEKEKSQNYPLRSNAPDCVFYLKTGTCNYGLNCRFNHPLHSKRVFKVVGDVKKELDENNGLISDVGKIECKYFSTSGGCSYGDACRYNHSTEKIESNTLNLNFLGLPMRPLEKECTFYMRNGTCGYGLNCRFHHPDPTEAKESDGDSLTNGYALRGDKSSPESHEPLHSSGLSQGDLPEQSNGVNFSNALPCATSMSPYLQGMPQYPSQNQVCMSLPVNKPFLPHEIVNADVNTTDASTHYEHLMQIEEFPERPGQPDCNHFMKTGDCKFRSSCRYNHPLRKAHKVRMPPLSAKGSYSKSAALSPVETPANSNSNPSNIQSGAVSARKQQTQNDEFPERPGQSECEYFLKTGYCKFKSACRYHHPRNRVSTSSLSALNEKGLPLRPGARICRNYEQGTCKYGKKCLFDHPDDSSPPVPFAAHDHGLTNVDITADSEIPLRNKTESDWGDGWVM